MKKKLIVLFMAFMMLFALYGCVQDDGGDDTDDTEVPELLILQVYGTGENNENTTSVSHSFIELYNPTDSDVNLSGWSIQYSKSGTDWQKLDLTGIIKSKHSFLILGRQQSSEGDNLNLVLTANDADMVWDIILNHKGVKICLLKSTELLTCVNPFDTDGAGTKADGYADMLGVAGNDAGSTIDGCEKSYKLIQSKQKSIRRTSLEDTDDNGEDFADVDYRPDKISNELKEQYSPRSLSDGAWQPFEE